jgi:RNA polymerase sigma-70 factor (sigma-E family)
VLTTSSPRGAGLGPRDKRRSRKKEPGNRSRLRRVYRSSWPAGVGVSAIGAESEVDAFDAFVRARMPSLLRFAHALTGDPHTAADLVQDALERTGMRWSRLDKQGDPEAYVRRAILNGRTSRWRKLRRETLVDALPERAGVTDPAGRDEQLWRLLKELPQRQRAVIVLRYYEDMSEEQIAQTLGCAPGTVKSQASKALAKLRAAMPAEETSWTG